MVTRTHSKKGSNSNNIKENSKNNFNLMAFCKTMFKEANYNFILTKVIPVIFILFVMFFAFYVRSGPINLNGLDDNVRSNVQNNLRNLITQDINYQYPNLNPVYIQDLVNEKYQEVLDTGVYERGSETIVVDDIVARNTLSVKNSFKADNGQTYLNAIDPYHFLRLSEIYYNTGHTGDELRTDANGNQVYYLSYKMAPNGVPIEDIPTFHVWLESLLFKMYGVNQDSSIGDMTRAIYLLPVLISMLSVIPIFLIIRKFSNDLFALFGGLLLVSIGIFVSRTVAGFVDTDAYNVFFPLMVVMFILYGLLSKDKVILSYSFVAIGGFFLGVFMWAWSAGWFIFAFLAMALIGHSGYRIIVNLLKGRTVVRSFSRIMSELGLLFTFVVSSIVFTYVFTKTNILSTTYTGIFSSVSGIASISSSNIWPNVFSSVAELNPASFPTVIGSVGGAIVSIIAMVGLLSLTLDFKAINDKFNLYKKILMVVGIVLFFMIIKQNLFLSMTANNSLIFLVILFSPIGVGLILSLLNKNSDVRIFLAIALSIWMSGTIYMSLNGVRFILLLAPAFSIAFALGLYYISKVVNNFIKSEFKIVGNLKENITGLIVASLLFIAFFHPIAVSAINISENTLPNFDDSWYSTMAKINENSSSDAIITSWWDFGHFFTAVAKRSVTFDGGSQTSPQSHWVGKLLLEGDIRKSHDILRMITCGGNNAHDDMFKFVNGNSADRVKINKIIYSTFGEVKTKKVDLIKNNPYYNFTDEQVDKVMSDLYCDNPREDFLITSEDMVGKTGVWTHWGSWDFTKKYVYDNYNKKSANVIAKEVDENETLIQKYIDELKAIDQKAKTQDIKRQDLVNQWFAPYPSYIPLDGRYFHDCQDMNYTFSCINGFMTINKSTGQITTKQGLNANFRAFIYPSITKGLDVIELDSTGDVDVVLLPTISGYQVMLAQAPLGESLFTKLFFLEGQVGKSPFELFDDKTSTTGVRIMTWKVNWNFYSD